MTRRAFLRRSIALPLAAALVLAVGVVGWAAASGGGGDAGPTPGPDETSASFANSAPANSVPESEANDELVTPDEHEAAIGGFLACVRQRGATAETYAGAGWRPTKLLLGWPDADGVPDADTARAVQAASSDCERAHLTDINDRWSAQLRRPTTTDIEAMFRRLEACVADGGIPSLGDVPVWAVSNRGYRDIKPSFTPNFSAGSEAAFRQCAVTEEAATGLAMPVANWNCGEPPGGVPRSKWITLCVVNGNKPPTEEQLNR